MREWGGMRNSVCSPFCGIFVTWEKYVVEVLPLPNERGRNLHSTVGSYEICPPWACPAHCKSPEIWGQLSFPVTESLCHLFYLGSNSDLLSNVIFHVRRGKLYAKAPLRLPWDQGAWRHDQWLPKLRRKGHQVPVSVGPSTPPWRKRGKEEGKETGSKWRQLGTLPLRTI